MSLLLRPVVCPATGTDPAKTMEIRFFAPASLVSNLDFVETIFGNGGDPYLPENDAALDVLHWTGHTGCVILAPHLVGMKKTDLGLPHYDAGDGAAAARRHVLARRGRSSTTTAGRSKSPAATMRGVMVTIIADNYFGYCKKEVKTQISYCGEPLRAVRGRTRRRRHCVPGLRARAGVSRRAGRSRSRRQPFEEAMRLLGDRVERAGRRVTRWTGSYPDIFYVPENCGFQRPRRDRCSGRCEGGTHQLTLRPDDDYVLPSGYKDPAGETDRRNGLAADRVGGARDALPQAVHGVRRRQIRDLEVHCRRHAAGTGLRQGLPPRHGAGGGDPEEGFLRHLQSSRSRRRARGGRS